MLRNSLSFFAQLLRVGRARFGPALGAGVKPCSRLGTFLWIRKQLFLRWATDHGVLAERCRFLTAFASRTSSEAKKALPRLARGTYAWFLDEPDGVLSWEDLADL
ncbi:MAG TPA: hypothetical protein VE196_05080 [Pseudonocardiaceae bacterium]|nr:hypothetical protein [Pseudonocardiaceae bacterium]